MGVFVYISRFPRFDVKKTTNCCKLSYGTLLIKIDFFFTHFVFIALCGPLRMGYHDLLIAMHIESHATARYINKKVLILLPLEGYQCSY